MDIEKAYKEVGSGAVLNERLCRMFSHFRSKTSCKSYNDKIREGKKVPGTELYSPLTLANRLMSPSYVSYETALHWYGLLPADCGYIVRSASRLWRSARTYYGRNKFTYTNQPEAYFEVGVAKVPVEDPLYFIATPEKALCDLMLDIQYLRFFKRSSVYRLLLDKMHMPEELLSRLSVELVAKCAAAAHRGKKNLEWLTLFLDEISCG